MAVDYTIYENWYKYMSNVINQIQGGSGYSGTSANRTASADQSFADTYMNLLQRMSGTDAAAKNSAAKTQNSSRIQTGSQSMDAIFEEAAQLYNVPVNLLKAVGKAESNFDANAVSAAGAQGVMQLMPATARALGVEDPFDARENIMAGAKYIAEKLNQYNGDIDLALAAYNAGSGNVAKYGGVPPFAETRNYISRIKRYMNSDLTTGKTVEGQPADANSGTSLSYWEWLQLGLDSQYIDTESASQTGLSYWDLLRAGLGSQYASAAGNRTSQSTYSLTQENAQYMVNMMRLQMLSKVSSLSTSDSLSGDSSGSNFFL